jgi:hypothetical protein
MKKKSSMQMKKSPAKINEKLEAANKKRWRYDDEKSICYYDEE